MKKLLLIILLTFTTFATADEGRYTMLASDYGIYVLDTEKGEVKYCLTITPSGENTKMSCTEWSEHVPLESEYIVTVTQ